MAKLVLNVDAFIAKVRAALPHITNEQLMRLIDAMAGEVERSGR